MDKKLKSIRKINSENNNLKNPTDILIFTSSYCFSPYSWLVKKFQNSGGAIIIGYNDNLKYTGTSLLDSSQSSSSVMAFSTKENLELESLGYHTYGIT